MTVQARVTALCNILIILDFAGGNAIPFGMEGRAQPWHDLLG